jgi:hypothetical protein
MAKQRRLGQKRCPQCEKWIKGRRSKVCPHCSYEFEAKRVPAPAAQPVTTATAEKPARAGAEITVEQIRQVGLMVRDIGGFDRFREMLDVIREVGGLKRLRELSEALAVTENADT